MIGTQQPIGGSPRRGRARGLGPAIKRSAHDSLRASVGTSGVAAAGLVVLGVALSWALSILLGGAGRVVPHWYYVPILFAAVRFGHPGALVVALVAGILAGPLTPQHVATGVAQVPSEWLTRTGFFTVIGQLAAVLVRPSLPSLSADVQRLRLERALGSALERGELELRYQPILALDSGRIAGVEALLRWQHPDRGLVTAGAFVPMVEQGAVIHALGDFALRQACADAAAWQRLTPEPLFMSVNLSAAELDSPALPTRIERALAGSGLEPGRLWLEVTESALIHDLDGSVARLHALRATGVRVAIDDFGTGYSSLSYVHRLPADALKIDRSFVEGLTTDRQGAAVIGGVTLLARSLGMTTVAEGVQGPEEARRLVGLGCDLAQGFHYARPLTAAAVTEWLHDERAVADGDAPATNGDRPATNGDRPATNGDQPATNGDRPATNGARPDRTRGRTPAPRRRSLGSP